jgi:hypothetical protein
MDLFNEKLIGENDKCKFFTNDNTRSSTNYARNEDLKGRKLDNWNVLEVEFKDSKDREFVLLNPKNEIVDKSLQLDGIGIVIDKWKCLMSEKRRKI